MRKWTILLIAFTLVLANVFMLGLPSTVNAESPQDLIISEYIEGSSYNKAIEIYNGTGADIDLSQYTLANFTNGASQTDGTVSNLNLSGTLKNGNVYVLANNKAEQAVLDIADISTSNGALNFNGDDAIVLFKHYDSSTKEGTVIDSIGQVANDPGSYWASGDVKTQDATLIRKVEIKTGDTNINDEYDPANGWAALPKDTFDYLGSYQTVTPEPEEPKDEYTAVVESITDGDTIKLVDPILGSDSVRYLNIDTPETYHLGSYDQNIIYSDPDHNQKFYGEHAKTYLKTLLQPGDEVTIKLGEEAQDQYGRLLAQVIRKSDGLNTNLEMVRQGYASSYFIWPVGDETTYNAYQAAVKSASDQHLGIWNTEHPLMELPFVFRAREQGKGLLRYVGNSDSKEYVQPKDWAQVPVNKRVFFASETEALSAGYTPGFEREPIVAEARLAPLGTNLTVEGIVTAIDGANHFIQDDTGGIVVRSYDLEAEIGDKITATGKTSEYYGMLQIITENTGVLQSDIGVPEAKLLKSSDLGESVEAQLVVLEDVTIESVNEHNEYSARDSKGTFTVDMNIGDLEVGKTYESISGVINYQFNKYMVTPRFDGDIVQDLPVIPIAGARAADIGTKVNIEGVVTAINGLNYYVQDDTGAIVVRVAGLNAQVGDKIQAKARTEEYFGLLEIIPSLQNAKIIEAGVGVPEPKLVTSSELGESLESQLVVIEYATVQSVDSHNNFTAEDPFGKFVIDSDSRLVETGVVYERIVGVVDYNFDEYKIMPRTAEDVVELSYFGDSLDGNDDLTAVTYNIIESSDTLGVETTKELLQTQLSETVETNGNTVQHIDSAVQHIGQSLEKIAEDKNLVEGLSAERLYNNVEFKKIEHELEKILKKNKRKAA